MKTTIATIACLLMSGTAYAQTSQAFNSFVSGLTAASTPLSSSDIFYVNQGGSSRQITQGNLFTFGISGFNLSSSGLIQTSATGTNGVFEHVLMNTSNGFANLELDASNGVSIKGWVFSKRTDDTLVLYPCTGCSNSGYGTAQMTWTNGGGFAAPNFSVNGSGAITATGLNTMSLSSLGGFGNTQTLNYGSGTVSGVNNSLFWYVNGARGTCSDSADCSTNKFALSDNVHVTSATNGMSDWWWTTSVGGDGAVGGRIGQRWSLLIGGALTCSTCNFQGSLTEVGAAVNVGGVAGGGANGVGSLFGNNPNVRLTSGATYWHQIVGDEVDVGIYTGASADNMVGHQVVQVTSVVESTTPGAQIAYSANKDATSTGFDLLYADGSWDGHPAIKAGGTLMGCMPHANSGNCGTITNGVDLSNYGTISGSAFKSTGFSVSGTGAITATNLKVTSATVPTNGLYLVTTNQVGLSVNSTNLVTYSSNAVLEAAAAGTDAVLQHIVYNSSAGFAHLELDASNGVAIKGWVWSKRTDDTLQLYPCSGCLNSGYGTAVLTFTAGGGLQMGAPTGGDKGAGTINAAAAYYANGSAGISKTCTVNQALTLIFTNGILTGGSCTS